MLLASGGAAWQLSDTELAPVLGRGLSDGVALLALATIWAAGLLPGDRLMPVLPVTSRLRFDVGEPDLRGGV